MRLAFAPWLLVLALVAGPGGAQAQASTVVQKESVRFEYARVLKVTPVYQKLTASRAEQHCDGATLAEGDSQFSRVVGAVKHVIRREGAEAVKMPASRVAPSPANCRTVQVDREFSRPIAYDVDYTHRGAVYRSRMADDPGSLLRIRVSVMPVP